MGRHKRSRTRQRARQVFASKGGHRGLIVLLFLVVLAVDLVLAVSHAERLAAAAPVSPPFHADIAYPRMLADEMAACGRVHGELAGDGESGIPIVGSGVFQRVVQVRRSGRTAFAVDPFSGRMVMSQLTPLEIHNTQGCDYAIEQYGDVPPRTLLLTFDDGPNPLWTPKVLAVLKAYDARATFFVIGENILRAPAAFKLIIESGNVVGNHTFSHLVLEDLAPAAAQSQLVTTSHIIAAVGGYQTRLFRTPYGSNYGSAQAGANVFATLVAQQLGFTEVGFTADSSDYEYPPSSEIPLPAFGGAGLPGQVIIMHDSGGKDDAATVRFLERILQKAEALGYRFMTVDQLLQQQGESSPAGPTQPTLGDRLGYWAAWARQMLPQTGLPLVLTVATWVVLGFGIIWITRAIYGGWRQHRPVPSWHPELVSVLIAAKDEKAVIRVTIESIFAYRYPFSLQVVVVNDGSMDGAGGTADGPGGTKAILDELSARYCHESCKLEVIHLDKNVGKAAALDLAFRTKIRGGVCAAFDADTRLGGPDTIPNLVRHFRDPKVGAVAGYIRAGNVTRHPWKWLLFRFQQAEYNLGIGLMRVAQGKKRHSDRPGRMLGLADLSHAEGRRSWRHRGRRRRCRAGTARGRVHRRPGHQGRGDNASTRDPQGHRQAVDTLDLRHRAEPMETQEDNGAGGRIRGAYLGHVVFGHGTAHSDSPDAVELRHRHNGRRQRKLVGACDLSSGIHKFPAVPEPDRNGGAAGMVMGSADRSLLPIYQ